MKNILFYFILSFTLISNTSYATSSVDIEMAKLDYEFLFSKMSKKELVMSPLCFRYNEVTEIIKKGEKVECASIRGRLESKSVSVEDVEKQLKNAMNLIQKIEARNILNRSIEEY